MKTEEEFRKYVTAVAEDMGGHVSNIESHMFSAGIPDMNIYLRTADVWLELKIVGKHGNIAMRPSQRKWHTDRHDIGGVSWVMVLDPATQSVGLVPGYVAAKLDSKLSAWYRRMYHFQTNELRQVLAKLTEYTHNEQKQSSNRRESPQGTGSARPPLHESGEGMGEHHWLTGKP